MVLSGISFYGYDIGRSFSNGSKELFALPDKELMYTTKWKAQVSFLVVFSVFKICKYNLLATMQLCIEWNNDHDTFPQFPGVFIGAIYGPGIFKSDTTEIITKKVQLAYDENIDKWVSTLIKVQQLGKTTKLFVNGK